MITIGELGMVRKIIGISEEKVSDEMNTSVKTIRAIENEQIPDPMTNRFYRLTILKLIKQIDFDKLIEKI